MALNVCTNSLKRKTQRCRRKSLEKTQSEYRKIAGNASVLQTRVKGLGNEKYKVICYYSREVSSPSKIGATLLGLDAAENPKETKPEQECDHRHRSLKAAIKCARSLARGFNMQYGDCCARVEDNLGTVLHDFHGGMRVSFH